MPSQHINLEYCRASSGKRFANYLIDLLVCYTIIFVVATLIELMYPGSMANLNLNPFMDKLTTILIYGFVMFVTEMSFRSKTLGKLITGTRVMTGGGKTINFGQLFIRNFVRAIPFNTMSALGVPCTPWHDTWSNTLVVDDKKVGLARRKEDFYSGLKNQGTLL